MYDIKANQAKNRVYLKLQGFLTDEEMHAGTDQLIAEVMTLRPGFDVINDISDYKPASPEGSRELERAQKFVLQHGVRHIMRVVGPNVIARMQFQRTSKEAGTQRISEEVATVEDAERRLDALNSGKF